MWTYNDAWSLEASFTGIVPHYETSYNFRPEIIRLSYRGPFWGRTVDSHGGNYI